MRCSGIPLDEQTEQKFRRFESVLRKQKRTSNCNRRVLLLIKAPTKNKNIFADIQSYSSGSATVAKKLSKYVISRGQGCQKYYPSEPRF